MYISYFYFMENGMKIKHELLAAVILVCFSNTIFAAESGGYVGAGLGVTYTTIKDTSTGTSDSYSSSGFNLLGGYQFNKNFAVEVEYVDLGKFTGAIVELESTGLGVSGVGVIPMPNNFSLFGKIGITNVDTKATARPGWILLVPASESKVGVSFGLGGQYEITPNATLRLSLNSYEYAALAGYLTGREGIFGVAGFFKF